MKHLTFLFLVLISFSAFGQQSNYTLKAYVNAEYTDDFFLSRSELGRLTLAVNQQLNDQYYHELELSHFSIQTNERFSFRFPGEIEQVRDFNLGIRYEVGMNLTRKPKGNFLLGIAALPRFNRVRTEIEDFPNTVFTSRFFFFTASIIPRFSYKISNAFLIEVNGILNAFQVEHENIKETGRDMGNSYWWPGAIGFRMGLAYRF